MEIRRIRKKSIKGKTLGLNHLKHRCGPPASAEIASREQAQQCTAGSSLPN
jgi:hypothetical protein